MNERSKPTLCPITMRFFDLRSADSLDSNGIKSVNSSDFKYMKSLFTKRSLHQEYQALSDSATAITGQFW